MSIQSLTNQDITVYPKSGFDKYGRAVTTTGVAEKARVQKTTKQRLLPNNTLVTIEAIAYVRSSSVANVDDKIVYAGTNYKVQGKYEAKDGAGQTSHYKLELTKWQI